MLVERVLDPVRLPGGRVDLRWAPCVSSPCSHLLPRALFSVSRSRTVLRLSLASCPVFLSKELLQDWCAPLLMQERVSVRPLSKPCMERRDRAFEAATPGDTVDLMQLSGVMRLVPDKTAEADFGALSRLEDITVLGDCDDDDVTPPLSPVAVPEVDCDATLHAHDVPSRDPPPLLAIPPTVNPPEDHGDPGDPDSHRPRTRPRLLSPVTVPEGTGTQIWEEYEKYDEDATAARVSLLEPSRAGRTAL